MSEKEECQVKVECSQEHEEEQPINNFNHEQNINQDQSHKYSQISSDDMKLTKRESIDPFNSTSAGTMTGNAAVLTTSCSDIDRYDDTGSFSDRMQLPRSSTRKKIHKISKTSNSMHNNCMKGKNRKKCGSICKTIERQSHAKRLDFDFTIFDTLIYATGMSPLSMAGLHKSLVSYELFKQPYPEDIRLSSHSSHNLLRITFDSTDKPKTPISLILKKLISDSHPSAKALCESLHYFHMLLKKFRSIRKNNSSKLMIFSQLMPILPRSEELKTLLQTSPEIPSVTATYTINAKKGRISLTHYTFNEQLAILLGYSNLSRMQRFIQVQQQLPNLSIPKDYYDYIMECLLNKFQCKETLVDMDIVTFDGIRIDVQERIISRSFIENDVTPEMINVKKEEEKQSQQDGGGVDGCGEGIGQDGMGGDEEDDEDDDDEEDDDGDDSTSNGPQGILLVMSKHFFTVKDKAMESYLFSKERLAICEEIVIPPAISKSQFSRITKQAGGNNSSKQQAADNNNFKQNQQQQQQQQKKNQKDRIEDNDQKVLKYQQQEYYEQQHNILSCLNGVASVDGTIVKKEEDIDEKDRLIGNQRGFNEGQQDKGSSQKWQEECEEDKQQQKRCRFRNILQSLS